MLKPIQQQVIFIVGATSELGVSTLRMAVAQGAKVFMVAKHERALEKIQNEMRLKNLPTAYAVADLSEVDQLQVAADQCLATFGTIDSWINLAEPLGNDVSIRENFDGSFWKVVNGSTVAVSILEKTGGSLINLANMHLKETQSGRAIQVALQEAIRGFSKQLNLELKKGKAPVSVSFISLENESQAETKDYAAAQILKCSSSSSEELKIGKKNLMRRLGDRLSEEKKLNRFAELPPLFRKKKLS